MHPTDLLLATLRFGGAVPPEALRAAWRALPATGLGRLIQFEGCELWLHRRLAQIGAVEPGGAPFAGWLAQRARDTAARNLLVDAQTVDVVRLFTAHDVPHVLLKGVARRALAPRLPFADARATRDVDVLVPAARAEEAWLRLCAAGCERVHPTGGTRPGHFDLPPLWNEARVAVALHTSTGPLVPPAEAWRRATAGGCVLEWDGVRVHVPTATELLWHGLTHAVRHRADTFRLRFLLDGTTILAAGVALDWDAIACRLATTEAEPVTVAQAWLGAAAELADVPLPRAVCDSDVRFDLGRALRWHQSVLRVLPPTGRLADVLAAEGARIELGAEWGSAPRPTSPLHLGARQVRAAAARGAYRVWRARGAEPRG
jgi:hypothetical protein